tara:strand:+ start:2594 stop:3319 length:726 start_codon:yes stop_codon:yes gene_type:complete
MQSENKLLEIGKNTAYKAGKFLLDNKLKNKVVESSEGRDIKLELDRLTETLIREELKSTSINILGEELGLDSNNSDRTWVIDPIDGTANYFRGLDQSCVSIALLEGDDALVGIIFNFNTNEMFYASKGGGSFLNGDQIQVSEIAQRKQASLTTGFPSSETITDGYNFIDSLQGWKKIRMFGSAALSCAYVASGRCDYYAERGIFLWDFAAGICLVKEAGGEADFERIDDKRYQVKFSNGFL